MEEVELLVLVVQEREKRREKEKGRSEEGKRGRGRGVEEGERWKRRGIIVGYTYYVQGEQEEEAEAYSSNLSMISFRCLLPKVLPLFQLKGKHNRAHHQ